MANRYSLRFDAGERHGENVPIPASGLSVGRRPDQTLQLLDSSVSGRHAEFLIDAQGVLLRDLGSTNGTRVRGERVIETHVAHGDRILFGNVSLTLVDGTASDRLLPTAHKVVAPSESPIERVSQNALARSRNRPKIALYALAGVAFVGVGAAWYLRRSGPVSARALKPVAAPAGNLLEDYSFESDADAWTAAGNSPTSFQKSGDARFSGAAGIACELEARTSAVTKSDEVRGEPRREFTTEAMVRCVGGARGAIGLEFSQLADGSQPAPAPLFLWSKPVEPAPDFARAEVSGTLPPGYAAVRVVVRGASGREPGRVDVDDVALFERAGTELPTIVFGERRLVSIGSPCVATTLLDGERVLLANIQFRVADALFPDEALPLSVREDPPASGRILLAVLGESPNGESAGGDVAGGDATSASLHLSCEARLRQGGASAGGSFDGGIATVGDDGYKTHGLEFERKRATDLLLGSGRSLVRITVAPGASIRGHAEGSACQISLHFAGSKPEAALQLDFQRERVEAGNAAHAARGAEKKGDFGESLRQWSVLLNAYPYEETLVREAEAARARLTEKGLEELRVVRADADNARFFRLIALFQQAREKAQRIARLYSPSEVEAQARTLLTQIEGEVAEREAGERAAERSRLVSIASALKARRADELARAVEDYVRTHMTSGE